LREAKRIAQRLAEVAELDGRFSLDGGSKQWDENSLSRREALVAELGEICRSHPMLAVESLGQFEAMLKRTRSIEIEIRSERNRLTLALHEAETNLKQLSAFGERMPGDSKLLNRLA